MTLSSGCLAIVVVWSERQMLKMLVEEVVSAQVAYHRTGSVAVGAQPVDKVVAELGETGRLPDTRRACLRIQTVVQQAEQGV